ncbi:plasmid mobilization protein [Berryella wangjianweii]
MPCPNDHRARSVTVSFRMTPAQSRWLDEVVAESGMTKQDFIMARLREDGITVVPNRRIFLALRDHMAEVLRELRRIDPGGEIRSELMESITRLTREFTELRGEETADVVAERLEGIIGLQRH